MPLSVYQTELLALNITLSCNIHSLKTYSVFLLNNYEHDALN